MDDTPRNRPARDDQEREMIENASADAAAGILPGGLGGFHAELDRAAGPDTDGDEGRDRQG